MARANRLVATVLAAAVAFGISVSGSITAGSCLDFVKGSPSLIALNAGGVAVPGVAYTNIVTKYDQLVQPHTSGFVSAPNVTNVVVQKHCPTDFADHLGLAYDRVAAQYILNALDPANAKPAPCTLVLPGLGG